MKAERFDTIIKFSLCGLIFTLPFSKSMVEIFFLIALGTWFLKRALSYRIGKSLIKIFKPVYTELNLPIYVFVLINLISLIMSTAHILSIRGFFFKLLELVMLYFMVVETFNSKKKINVILTTMLFSMVVVGIDGIFQYVKGVDFLRHYPILSNNRIQGPFSNPNGLAGWLLVMFPLSLSFAYSTDEYIINSSIRYSWLKNSIKPLAYLLSGLLLVCLALTYARGAWVAALLSLVFLGIFCNKKMITAKVASMLVLIFYIESHINSRTYSTAKSSMVIRLDLWREALAIIRDFPLVGSGLNTYALMAKTYKASENTGFYPHNSYLQMAAEIGILGLLSFIWIIVSLFRVSVSNINKSLNKFYKYILLGLLTGLLGLLAHSFVDVDFYALQLASLMWLIMGLIIAVQRIALKEESKSRGYSA